MLSNKYTVNEIGELFQNLIILIGVVLCGGVALFMMYLHIIYLPNTFNLMIREPILMIGSIGFYILAKRNNMKALRIVSTIIILLSIFNLVGFNIYVMVF